MTPEQELEQVNEQIRQLSKRRGELQTLIDKQNAAAFIKATGITKSQVHTPDMLGVPWFGMLPPYATWLEKNGLHRDYKYAAWNTSIYHMSDILRCDMSKPLPITTSDL